jgi:predicted dehydrogenase
VRVLIAGLGGIGQRHIRNLRHLLGPDADLVAYRVRRDSRTLTDSLAIEPGESVEQKYDLRVFDDVDAAINERPDAVLVCNPTSLHLAIAIKAAEAGCALFIEKPIASSMDGTGDLIDAVEKRGLVGLVGYQMRFHPTLRRARDLLQAGAVGRVVAVRIEMGEFLPGWHPYEDYRQMYASRADLGGGVILSQIHELDYAYWFFGMPNRVLAVGGHLTRLEVDVEDVASILLVCSIDGRDVPVHVQLDYIQRPPSRTCEIIGDAGKIIVDLRQHALTLFDANGTMVESTTNPGFARNQLFLDEMTHFLACIDGRESPSVSIRDGVRSLQIALAAKESIATGRIVSVPRETQ